MLGGPGVYLEEFLRLEPGAAWRLWEGPGRWGRRWGGHSWHTCAVEATLGSGAPAQATALCSPWPLKPRRRGQGGRHFSVTDEPRLWDLGGDRLCPAPWGTLPGLGDPPVRRASSPVATGAVVGAGRGG